VAPVREVREGSTGKAGQKAEDSLSVVLDRKSDGHFYAMVEVNGRPVRFLVDTGASAIALTADDAHALGFGWTPSELTIVGRGASGEVMGKIVELHHVKLGGKEAWNMRAAIIPEGLPVSLLGQSFLGQIGSVRIANDQMVLR
jgi:aspartyl protease family protein